MKSALFESINDRSNIANAYFGMVEEAVQKHQDDEIQRVKELFEEKTYPLCIYDEDADPGSDIIDLTDVQMKYGDPSDYDDGSDDYYIALAFDRLSLADLYKRLLEIDKDYVMSPFQLQTRDYECIMTMSDLRNDLLNVGKEIEDDLHADYSEVLIPEWAVTYIEYGDDSGLTEEERNMVDKFVDGVSDMGLRLVNGGRSAGFCRIPAFGLATDCEIYYMVPENAARNESVEEDGGWFDSEGNLLRDIPDACVRDCTVPGRDAYEYCKKWVESLGFDKGLDLPLVKGFLKTTGAWNDEEIAALTPKEAAIKLLWIVCGDIDDGIDSVYIGDCERFGDVKESSDSDTYRVVVTGLEWPKGSPQDVEMPFRDAMTVEVRDGEKIEDVVKAIYMDSFGVAPMDGFHVKSKWLGHSFDFRNEVVSQRELDKLKKKNPDLKDISED